MKKTSLCFCFAFVFSISTVQAQKELVKLWQTEANLKVPESVLYDAGTKSLYFSNIDGNYMEKDHKGSIGKMNADGKNVTIDWVSGLNAPKGIGKYKDLLYV